MRCPSWPEGGRSKESGRCDQRKVQCYRDGVSYTNHIHAHLCCGGGVLSSCVKRIEFVLILLQDIDSCEAAWAVARFVRNPNLWSTSSEINSDKFENNRQNSTNWINLFSRTAHPLLNMTCSFLLSTFSCFNLPFLSQWLAKSINLMIEVVCATLFTFGESSVFQQYF